MAGSESQPNRARCPCGATLTLPAGAAGKRVRCPSCKRTLVVRAPAAADAVRPLRAARETGRRTAVAEQQTCRACRAGLPTGATVCPRCGYDFQTKSYAGAADAAAPAASPLTPQRGEQGFWSAALWSFLCFADTQNMVVLAVVSAISVVGVFAGMAPSCLGMLCQFIVYGWLCSFYINVLLSAASGEDELPKITLTEGWMEGIIQPAMMFIVSWTAVQLPAALFAVLSGAATYAAELAEWAVQMWTSRTFPTEALVWIALTLGGAFCWPSAILLMSMSSPLNVIRADLWVRTIIRTFPVYVAICGLLGLVCVSQIVVTVLVGGLLSASSKTALGLAMAGSVVSAYGWVVTMRIIGLYYLHYKHRFPWRAE